METTDKAVCRQVAELLAAHGAENVVLSPGSRNAPLIVAVVRHPSLRHYVVVDERQAAFVALGLAAQTQKPVALICTSGTAMLNYAPAVAEAFYRQIPLIVITADRPQEWIDQDDSQTIHQPYALANIVKHSTDIPAETGDATQLWMVNRMLNDAITDALQGAPGPVHINLQLDVPLCGLAEADYRTRCIDIVSAPTLLPTAQVRRMAAELAPPKRVLVIAGFMQPSQKVSRAMARLAALPNVAVLHEAQTNIHGKGLHGHIDNLLGAMTETERLDMLPDVVITVGGSLVSRFIKSWLRDRNDISHWHVGIHGHSVDCFKMLMRRIELPATTFIPQLASAMQPFAGCDSDYARHWRELEQRAQASAEKFVATAPWTDLTATQTLFAALPARANLQVSNGTAVRYLQLSDYSNAHRIDSNRGVSGIDGCTSTAIGAAMGYGDLTVLVSGDMSAQYDMSALACNYIPATFRMAVLNNGGGGIFRFINSTRGLDELEECFACKLRLPLRDLARGFGFKYLEADSEESLRGALTEFYGRSDKPIILNIITDGTLSARILNEYFHSLKNI